MKLNDQKKAQELIRKQSAWVTSRFPVPPFRVEDQKLVKKYRKLKNETSK
jgi:hypothetical protein